MTTVAAVPHSQVEVDPRILAIIGDPAAPRAKLRERVIPPASLPGKLGLRADVQLIAGARLRGAPYFASLHQKHGDLLRWSYGREHVVLTWDIDTVQRILRNEEAAFSCAMGWDSLLFGRVEPDAGNAGGLVALDFEPHRLARRISQHAFTPKAIRGYLDIARPLIRAAIESWVAAGRVDFKTASRSLLSDVANAIFTGIASKAERQRVDRGLRAVWGASMTLLDQEWLSRALHEGRKEWQTLNVCFAELAKERAAQPGTDMLSQFVLAREADAPSDPRFVKSFLTIMLAAYDTTSAAVTSMAYLLAKHPAWQEQLRAEALSHPHQELTSLQQLEKHEWVWKETLRILPIAAFAPRRTLREVELLGHRLPAGCMVGAELGPTGYDPRNWNEPERFDPERFSSARAEDKRRPGLYTPFGSGAHACMGMMLAGSEAKLLFSELLTRCRFTLRKDYRAHHTYAPLGIVSGGVSLQLEAL